MVRKSSLAHTRSVHAYGMSRALVSQLGNTHTESLSVSTFRGRPPRLLAGSGPAAYLSLDPLLSSSTHCIQHKLQH